MGLRAYSRGLWALIAVTLLVACASGGPSPGAPAGASPAATARATDPLSGDFAAITPGEAAQGNHDGAWVRWGGGIEWVDVVQGRTCFVMRVARLSPDGLPVWTNQPTGERFVACRPGTYDTRRFTPYREVTFVGRIDGEQRLSGERVARIQASVVYLWSDCLATDTSPHCLSGPVEPVEPAR